MIPLLWLTPMCPFRLHPAVILLERLRTSFSPTTVFDLIVARTWLVTHSALSSKILDRWCYNLSALVIGTFLPVSPIAAVFLNNGSCLVAAGNAIRALGFRRNLCRQPASASQEVVDVGVSESGHESETLDFRRWQKSRGELPENLCPQASL